VGQALGDVLPLAVAIAIFPVPIIAVVLLLGAERGVAKGLAFGLAWCAGLAAVGGIVLAVAGLLDATDGGEPATWVSLALLGLGALLVLLAARGWRGRPRAGEEAPTPGWMRAIDGFTVAKAGAAGFALSGLNPKNAMLAAAAAAEIAEVGLPAGQQVAVLAGFVLVASVGVLAPVVVAVALGDRSRGLLDGLRTALTRHSAAIMAALFLVIGAKLIGDAIAGLAA
jgi:threonine/homoserine/homoserine lactone efflux protein